MTLMNMGTEAKIINVDRKNRLIFVSMKAKDQAEEQEAVAALNQKEEDGQVPSTMANAFKAAQNDSE